MIKKVNQTQWIKITGYTRIQTKFTMLSLPAFRTSTCVWSISVQTTTPVFTYTDELAFICILTKKKNMKRSKTIQDLNRYYWPWIVESNLPCNSVLAIRRHNHKSRSHLCLNKIRGRRVNRAHIRSHLHKK